MIFVLCAPYRRTEGPNTFFLLKKTFFLDFRLLVVPRFLSQFHQIMKRSRGPGDDEASSMDTHANKRTTKVRTLTGKALLDQEDMGLLSQASPFVARLIEMNPNDELITLAVTSDFVAACVTILRAFLEWQQIDSLEALDSLVNESSLVEFGATTGSKAAKCGPTQVPKEEMRVLVARMIQKIMDDPASLFYAKSLGMHENMCSMAEQVRATLTVPYGPAGPTGLYAMFMSHGLTDKEVAHFFGHLPRPVQGPPLAHMLCAVIIKTIRKPGNNAVAIEFKQHDGNGAVQSAYMCFGLKEEASVAITSIEPDGTVTVSIQKFRESLLAAKLPLAGGSTLNWLLIDIAENLGKLGRE